jgi:hypothetical protein
MLSQDQLIAQLRILLPALGMLATVLGAKQQTTNQVIDLILTCVGPAMLVGGSVWSLFANTRASIMASAAKPVSPGVPAPQIVLPREEKELAENLPPNVTATN